MLLMRTSLSFGMKAASPTPTRPPIRARIPTPTPSARPPGVPRTSGSSVSSMRPSMLVSQRSGGRGSKLAPMAW